MSTEKTRNKTYIFTSLTLGGLRLRLLEQAPNLRAAVNLFAKNKPPYPDAMNWFVCLEGSKTSHPMSAERWGHAFYGKD